MAFGKYIIIETMGHEVAIMFSNLISHADFLQSFHRDCIKSAGFFEVGAMPHDEDKLDISCCVFGKSTTLKMEVRQNKDDKLLKKVLRKRN